MTHRARHDTWFWWSTLSLWILTTPVMAWAIYMAFLYAPDERVMGPVQRIFYFHVPAAIVTFLSVFVLMAAAMGYLWTRRTGLDALARASAEISFLLCTLVLVTGPIWARPAWGVWWTWEARLTTTLILWLLLAGCLLVRRYSPDAETGARLSAVLGIVAALDVPVVYKAVDWWRGQHPKVFGPGKEAPLDPRMRDAFLAGMLAFFLLYVLMTVVRWWQASLESEMEALREGVLERARAEEAAS